MNYDITDSDNSVTMTFTVDDDPPYNNNLSITDTKRCENPLCTNFAAPFSDYCRKHKGETIPDIKNDDPLFNRKSSPSNRDLQRQLDRLEGKIDALIAALTEDD